MGSLNKSDVNFLMYSYNSVYMKLFSSFDKTVLKLCQFYSGQLPVNYIADLKTLNFYAGLSALCSSPANVLFKRFGQSERVHIEMKYGIAGTDSPGIYKYNVHSTFNNYARTLM